MENTGMSWAEKFRILRETLNWPATHIIEYIDAGYTVPAFSIYTMIRRLSGVDLSALLR